MKILFFSDIHGISDNLSYIKQIDENEKFDKIVVLGDLYYPGPIFDNSKQIKSKEVKDFLMGYQERLICMKGNCDSDVDIKASDFPIC
ncbi:MAG: metallophosphoesterase, partial [Clostridia bacterium]